MEKLNLTIDQFIQSSYVNSSLTNDVIKPRRMATQEANGKKPSNNIYS